MPGKKLYDFGHLHQAASYTSPENGEHAVSVQDEIRNVTEAVAPVLLPMIDQLSGLDESELMSTGMLDDGS